MAAHSTAKHVNKAVLVQNNHKERQIIKSSSDIWSW